MSSPRLISALGAIAAAALLALPAGASAAAAPTVSTGPAQQVQSTSALLSGAIDPQGQSTSYFFQYGNSRAYGSQTAIEQLAPADAPVHVSIAVGSLKPLSGYHFRLIAVNGAGAGTGADESFSTGGVPLSLQIAATPDPATYGYGAVIAGTLSGTGAGGRPVVLQENPFPYLGGFVTVGAAQSTSATGTFAFPLAPLTAATEYRVATATPPSVVSAAVLEPVAVRVAAHVRSTRRRRYARFYGTVTPDETGMRIAIMRVQGGQESLAGGTLLRPLNAASSRYSVVVRVRAGHYRVLAQIDDDSHTSAYSTALLIR